MMVDLIEKIYSFLWGDLVHIPLPGGSTLGISLLIILLIPAGIYFTIRKPGRCGCGDFSRWCRGCVLDVGNSADRFIYSIY